MAGQRMSLHEEVAQRFEGIRARLTDDMLNAQGPDRVNARAFLSLNHDISKACADEAIRFADWARRDAMAKYQIYSNDYTSGVIWPDLTLPPEGWKP
jgi:hypothetical protein